MISLRPILSLLADAMFYSVYCLFVLNFFARFVNLGTPSGQNKRCEDKTHPRNSETPPHFGSQGDIGHEGNGQAHGQCCNNQKIEHKWHITGSRLAGSVWVIIHKYEIYGTNEKWKNLTFLKFLRTRAILGH